MIPRLLYLSLHYPACQRDKDVSRACILPHRALNSQIENCKLLLRGIVILRREVAGSEKDARYVIRG